MRKTTLLTLALSVSALFASAQSYTADKVYSIKNKATNQKVYYAAAMPQTSDMACSAADKLDLSCLFTITPTGEDGVYTIKPYADNTKVVYAIKVANDANNTVGIKNSDNADDTKWKIAEVTGANGCVSIISASATESDNKAYWNCRGKNDGWNLEGIGSFAAASGNIRSLWTIAEVSEDQIKDATVQFKTNFTNIYSSISTDQIKEQVGYYSQSLINEVKNNITNAADDKTAYKAAKSLGQLINLPVDGKAYKMYGLFSDNTKAYLKSNENDVFIMQKQADGKYKIVSSKADEKNLIYTGKGHESGKKVSLFDIKVRDRKNFGALNLVTGEQFEANVCIKKDASELNQYKTGAYNTDNSTEWYFEEVTDYTGHAVNFTKSTDGKAYATLNLPFATTIPAGVTAYKKGESTVSSVKLEEYNPTNNVLPANTPVLLQADNAETKTFAPAAYVAQENTGFSGTLAAANVSAENAYILAKDGDAVKFCKLSATNNTVNANKAYFTLTAAAANALNFDFGGVTTGIENAVADKANNAPIYDLSGRRVMNAVKGGIYIQNGKKFVK